MHQLEFFSSLRTCFFFYPAGMLDLEDSNKGVWLGWKIE